MNSKAALMIAAQLGCVFLFPTLVLGSNQNFYPSQRAKVGPPIKRVPEEIVDALANHRVDRGLKITWQEEYFLPTRAVAKAQLNDDDPFGKGEVKVDPKKLPEKSMFRAPGGLIVDGKGNYHAAVSSVAWSRGKPVFQHWRKSRWEQRYLLHWLSEAQGYLYDEEDIKSVLNQFELPLAAVMMTCIPRETEFFNQLSRAKLTKETSTWAGQPAFVVESAWRRYYLDPKRDYRFLGYETLGKYHRTLEVAYKPASAQLDLIVVREPDGREATFTDFVYEDRQVTKKDFLTSFPQGTLVRAKSSSGDFENFVMLDGELESLTDANRDRLHPRVLRHDRP